MGTARHPGHVAARLAPALGGLHLVRAGRTFGADGIADRDRARRFLGWSTNDHWMRTNSALDGIL